MTTFVLSDDFNYADYMPDDAGPRFAAMYDWTCLPLSKCDFLQNNAYVIDWHLSEREFSVLSGVITSHPRTSFVFHTIDPGPHIRGTTAYRWLMSNCKVRNVSLSGPFLPTENIANIFARGQQRYIFTPYLYEAEREVPIEHQRRRNAILLTGNVGRNDYPVRAEINEAAWSNPFFWGRVHRLRHSGYDLSNLRHCLIRDRYIETLSKYKFAVVCSSRLRLEFLKYRELAYAGCVPVGDMPGTLADCPADCFIPWRRNFIATYRLLNSNNTEFRAIMFRAYMSRTRHRDTWRTLVYQRLQETASQIRSNHDSVGFLLERAPSHPNA